MNHRMQPIPVPVCNAPRGQVAVCRNPVVPQQVNAVLHGYFANVIHQAPYGQGTVGGGGMMQQTLYLGQVQGHYQPPPPQQLGHYGHGQNGWYQQPHGGRW